MIGAAGRAILGSSTEGPTKRSRALPSNQFLWLFFGFSGRISRAAFLLAGLLMMVVILFVVYRMVLADDLDSGSLSMWEGAFSLLLLASLWAQAALGAKRMHDLDKPGAFAVLLFLPFVNFLAFIGLCIIPGTPGANSYGRTTNAPA